MLTLEKALHALLADTRTGASMTVDQVRSGAVTFVLVVTGIFIPLLGLLFMGPGQ